MSIIVRIGIAASILGVSTRTLRRWNAAGTITCHRMAGRHRQFSIADLRDSRE
ncbi:MAG: MerR family DNA-binding transcriptional regulator [Promethearchaeota archaeon]